MKIAISAQKPDLAGPIGKSPAQSDYWVIFDTANQSFTVIDKKHLEFGREQFWPDFLAQNNIAIVVAEDFSPAIRDRLKSNHIKAMQFPSASIQEAVASASFRDNEAANGVIMQETLV